MRISSLRIDGFGTWSGLELDELADGLNVFYGPNEAGKTTLLQFVRSVFYGFSPARRARYLPPVHGGRAGGMAHVVGHEGPVTISRHDEDPAAGTREGHLVVVGPDGGPADRQALARLFGPVDEAVYSNVFAVGLREMQELGTLSDTEAADYLYKLSTGLDRVSLVDVMRELSASRERLLAGGEGPSQIKHLVDERARLTNQAEELKGLSRRYAQLAQQRKESRAAIAAMEKDAAARERDARRIEIACAVHARWRERQDLQRELAALADAPRVAHDAVERLDRAIAARRKARHRLRRTRARQAVVRKQIAQLGASDIVWRHAPRIEALLEQEAWIAMLENQARAAATDAEALAEQVRVEHEALGLGTESPAIDDARHGPRALRGLRPLVRDLRQARIRARQADEQAGQCEQALARVKGEVEAALVSRPQSDVLAAVETAGQHVAQLRRRVQLDGRLDEMKQREAELRSTASEWLQRQLLSPWVLAGLGALFVVGVSSILTGLLLPQSFLGPAGWVLAILGAVGVASAAAAKVLLERSATRRYEACQQQLAALAGQAEETKRERDELDSRLPKGGGPMLTRLQAAEKDLAALEELLPLNARRETAEKEAKAAAERRRQSHEEYRDLVRRWRQSLVVAGLPEELSPRQLWQLAAGSKRLLAVQSRLAEKRQELAARQQELRVLAQRVDQLLAEIGSPVAVGAIGDKLRVLREQLRQHTTTAQQREALHETLRRLRIRQTKLQNAARRWRRRRRRLLARYAAGSPEHLRRLALQSARAELLAKQRDALAQEITAALAPHAVEDDVRELIERNSKEKLEEIWTGLAAEIQSTRERLRAAHEQVGRIEQELTNLAADRLTGDVLLRLGVVEQQLREKIARWRVLAVSGMLLERIRRMYESQRQPETLREASVYLALLTDGHYTRVWTPIEGRVLRVDDSHGNTLPLEVLSRGTREQLFLSLRLALVAAYARRGVELPLVLDDVLVNFDAQRARLAAALLRDFAAEGRQLFVFTCHEHVYKLFKSQKAAARELPPCGERAETTIAAPRIRAAEPRIEPPVDLPTPPLELAPIDAVTHVVTAGNGDGGVALATSAAQAEVAPPSNGHDETLRNQYEDEPDGFVELRERRREALARIGRREGPFAGSIWHDPVELEFGDE